MHNSGGDGVILPPPPSEPPQHYDGCSPHYQSLWGVHVHHGLWRPGQEDLPKEIAQERLVDEMLANARLPAGAKVLDCGCGVGGTSIKLQKEGFKMTGVSLSSVQIEMAKKNMADAGVDGIRFLQMDGEQLDFPGEDGTFDAVWISEALSHFPHKEKFFAHAMRLLKPGGKWVCVDWFRADNASQKHMDGVVADIEKGMLLPRLEPVTRYISLFTEAGGRVVYLDDVSKYCAKTWDICLELIGKPALWSMALTMGTDFIAFLHAFKAMRDGFACGAFRFTILIGEKPTADEVA
jgi:tocopherol O-methyltransferase